MTKKVIQAKAAPYPKTNIPEVLAVRVLDYIIDTNQLKTSLAVLDKVPNVDGHIEAVTPDQYPIGKIEVQVKYLPEKNYAKPRYQCDVQFLAYCEDSILPVLLIAVNTRDDKAYWIHLSKKNLKEIAKKIKGKTVSIPIPSENIIAKSQGAYLQSWISIINDYKTKLIDYDSIKTELEETKQLHKAMKLLSNPAVGLDKAEFKEIHFFLDYYNTFLDHDFSIIKEVFYKEYWKIGIAYSRYENYRLTYSLYPIEYTTNDVQIKYITDKEVRPLKNILNSVSHYTTNPIKYEPKELAYQYVIEDLKKIVDKQMLLPINEYVAREYIVTFLDKLEEITKFSHNQDSYSIEDVQYFLDIFLPLFIEEYLQNKDLNEAILFDLDHFRWHVFAEELIEVHHRLEKRMQEGKIKPTLAKLNIASSDFNLEYLYNLIQYLQTIDIHTIKRPHPPKNYPQTESYYIWQVYSEQDVRMATTLIFKNLPGLYDRFVSDYFPKLSRELAFYSFFDRLIINIESLEPDNLRGGYGVQMIYLKSDNPKVEKRTDVYLLGKDESVFSFKLFGRQKNITIDEDHYEIISSSSTHLENVFRDLPMQDYLYDTLKNRLERYLKPFHKGLNIFRFTKI